MRIHHLINSSIYSRTQDSIITQPDSRTAKAWELTQKHYWNCSEDNTILFNEIYKYVCKNKTFFGCKFFSSFANPDNLSEERIKNPDYYQDRMVYNIKLFLQINMDELANSPFYGKYI